MQRTILVWLCSLFCLLPPALAAKKPATNYLKDFKEYVAQSMEDWDIPGLAVGVIQNGKIVFLKGYGVCKRGENAPITPQTVFRLASVSKTFASGLSAVLVQEGVWSWDEPVSAHLPKFRTSNRTHTKQLTLTHLLSHTSGFPRHTFTHMLDRARSYKSACKKLHKVKRACAPGKCYTYQNVVYSLVGSMVKSATNKSYSQLLSEKVFKPLKMSQASCGYKNFMAASNRAYPHVKKEGWHTPLEPNKRYYDVTPASGVNCSILDLAKWMREIVRSDPQLFTKDNRRKMLTPRIRSKEEIKRFRSPWRLARVSNAHYGLGWRIFRYAKTKMLYHAGAVEGFGASMAYLPEYQVGIVVMSNSTAFVTNAIMARFLDTAMGLELIDYFDQ